jgi:hypothetical protein
LRPETWERVRVPQPPFRFAGVAIQTSCAISSSPQPLETKRRRGLPASFSPKTIHTTFTTSLFFKWIKPNRQNLRIKHFYGTSENAVKTQIWIAVCVYVLAAIIRRELMLKISLYTFLQILSVHSFEKIELSWAFQDVDDDNSSQAIANQLNLFES